MKRVLVCGGRDYGKIDARRPLDHPKRAAERRRVYEVLDALEAKIGTFVVINGGGSGADAASTGWTHQAVDRPVPDVYKAAWNDLSNPDAVVKMHKAGPNAGKKYDANAGPRRNQRMIDEGKPDLVVAFPGGTGTADMIERAERAGIPVEKIA